MYVDSSMSDRAEGDGVRVGEQEFLQRLWAGEELHADGTLHPPHDDRKDRERDCACYCARCGHRWDEKIRGFNFRGDPRGVVCPSCKGSTAMAYPYFEPRNADA